MEKRVPNYAKPHQVVIVAALLAVGCVPIEPTAFRGPNGGAAFVMQCSGMGRTLEACYQKAGELCPNGYNVVDARTGTAAVGNSGWMVAAPQRSLAVECRG